MHGVEWMSRDDGIQGEEYESFIDASGNEQMERVVPLPDPSLTPKGAYMASTHMLETMIGAQRWRSRGMEADREDVFDDDHLHGTTERSSSLAQARRTVQVSLNRNATQSAPEHETQQSTRGDLYDGYNPTLPKRVVMPFTRRTLTGGVVRDGVETGNVVRKTGIAAVRLPSMRLNDDEVDTGRRGEVSNSFSSAARGGVMLSEMPEGDGITGAAGVDVAPRLRGGVAISSRDVSNARDAQRQATFLAKGADFRAARSKATDAAASRKGSITNFMDSARVVAAHVASGSDSVRASDARRVDGSKANPLNASAARKAASDVADARAALETATYKASRVGDGAMARRAARDVEDARAALESAIEHARHVDKGQRRIGSDTHNTDETVWDSLASRPLAATLNSSKSTSTFDATPNTRDGLIQGLSAYVPTTLKPSSKRFSLGGRTGNATANSSKRGQASSASRDFNDDAMRVAAHVLSTGVSKTGGVTRQAERDGGFGEAAPRVFSHGFERGRETPSFESRRGDHDDFDQ